MQEAFYDKTTTRLLEIDYHHTMPWNKEDVYDLGRLIMEVYDNKSQREIRHYWFGLNVHASFAK